MDQPCIAATSATYDRPSPCALAARLCVHT